MSDVLETLMACSTMMYDAFPGKRDISLANPYYYHAENTQADGNQVWQT